MTRRVVITGIGMVTPLGIGVDDTWQALLAGESGAEKISLFDVSTFPCQIAAEVKGFDFKARLKRKRKFDRIGRSTQFALVAAEEALGDARLVEGNFDANRAGIYLGAGEGELDFFNFVDALAAADADETLSLSQFLQAGSRLLDPIREFEQEPNMASCHIADLFGLRGANSSCLTACAAGGQAIGEAFNLIRRGDADIMLAGGCHSMIHPFGVMGFTRLTALSTRNDAPKKASRPFDAKRDGFLLGEGAGIVVLEELQHAKSRNARIYAEVAGYGSTSDAFRITDEHPEGRGAISVMERALKDADCRPEDIGYINAHGTSTPVNDRVETLAIKKVFGECAYKVPVSSTKSMMGHLIGAAGAVELIICSLAMRDSILPPTINYEFPDPECDLDYVPNVARPARVGVAFSNSFGFGGQNVCLVVRGPQRYT